MHAIETEYAGYRFRSRLEARWAVFFDTAGIPYQYEPEGFEVSYRLEHDSERTFRYLPDFWLPGENAWVEVKGRWTYEESWRFVNAAACLSDNYTRRPEGVGAIIAGDIFRQPRYGITTPWILTMYKGEMTATPYEFGLTGLYRDLPPVFVADDDRSREPMDFDLLLNGATFPGADNALYRAASRAAQQARFEFGETPGRGTW